MAPIVPFWATRDQAQAPTSHSFISHPSPFSAFAFPFPLLLVPFSLYLIHSQICKVTHKTKQLLSLRSPNFACKFLDSGGVASCDFLCSATQYREQNGTTGDILLAVWGLAGLEVLCSTTLDTYNRSGSQAWPGCPYSSSHWIKSKLFFFLYRCSLLLNTL